MSGRQRRQSPEEQARMQRETAQENAATQRGLSDAQQGSIDLSAFGESDLIEEFSEPDIAGDDDDLEEALAAEFGRHLAFGNIDQIEYDRQALLDRARARLMKTEFPRDGRIGSRCRGHIRAIMVPEDNEKPLLDDHMGRQIDSAYEERRMARSLSKDARGFRGVTEAIVETRSNTDTDNDSSGGIISRLFA